MGCQDVSALPDEEVVEGDVEVGGPESSDELLVPQDIVAVGKVVAEGAAESSVLKWGITASVIYPGRQVSKKLANCKVHCSVPGSCPFISPYPKGTTTA